MWTFYKLHCMGCILMMSAGIAAQPSFEQATRQWKQFCPTRSVIPGAMVDVDGDLVDDLMVLDRGERAIFLKSRGRFTGFQSLDTLAISTSSQWTVAAGDLTGDGIPEFLTAGATGPVSVVRWNNTSGALMRSPVPSNIYGQGSASIDVDNDGDLDYFLANDNGYSRFYINDGNGQLQFQQVIDFSAGDPTDGSGNYGIEWTDVNLDGRPDLYLAKCRAGVDNPADPRRINRLYIQQADGTFLNLAKAYGVDSGAQSWTGSFGDLDNDGDDDLLVTNHYAPHQWFENKEGVYFTPFSPGFTLQSFALQSVMRDFDNDGLLDILLAGVEGAMLLHNKGNLKFERIVQPLGPAPVRSFTCGDVNDDGFLDVHAHISEPINETGLLPDQLWLGIPNGNSSIRIVLRGRSSNPSGIGARLNLYGPWGKQSRFVKGGEGYGVTHSLSQHFGIGTATHADSLEVVWPSGHRDIIYSPAAAETYLVQEGLCTTRRHTWGKDAFYKTNTDLPVLLAPSGFTSYTWSSGHTDRQFAADEGIWTVTMQSDNGCVTQSAPIEVMNGCFTPQSSVLFETGPVSVCAGDTYLLGARPAAAYTWSNGGTAQWIPVSSTGWVYLEAADYCDSRHRDSVYIEFKEILLTAKGDTILEGQRAMLTASLPNTVWYADEMTSVPLGRGATFQSEPLTTPAVFYAKADSILDSNTNKTGEKVFPVTNLYGANSVLGGLWFDVNDVCILRSVRVNTDTEGKRRIQIWAASGKIIFEKDVFIKTGISTIPLHARLNPGKSYVITCDEAVSRSELGFASPRLVRTFGPTNYPYSIDEVISLQSSTFGPQYYYYFYDWEIEYDLLECESGTIPVQVAVTPSSSEDPFFSRNGSVHPNPASAQLHILWPQNCSGAVIVSSDGRQMAFLTAGSPSIDISRWPSGIYVLRFSSVNASPAVRFVKL